MTLRSCEDEKIGEAELLLELFEQVDHLGLYGNVEGGKRVRRTR